MAKKITSSVSPHHASQLLTGLAIGLVVVALIVPLIIYLQATKDFVKLTTLRQTLLSSQATVSDQTQTQDYIMSHLSQIQAMLASFPTEADFIDFLVDLESLTRRYDPNSVITPGSDAVKVDQQLTVPLHITLTASTPTLLEYLKAIERLPYIIEINHIDIESPSGLDQTSIIKLATRVYVKDPFR